MEKEIRTLNRVIAGKHVLLDTCVLMDIVEHLPEKGGFFDLYNSFIQSSCTLIISPFIKHELLSGDLSKPAREAKRNILGVFGAEEVLPLPQEVYDWMLEFSWLYTSQGLKNCGIVDFSNLAYMRKYPNHVLLATSNHSDYSTRIVDREYIYSIDDFDRKIFNVGFYKWNEEKFTSLKEKISHLLE